MTAGERDQLKQRVDQARRLVAIERQPAAQRCGGCGCPHELYDPYCRTCDNRRRNRAARGQTARSDLDRDAPGRRTRGTSNTGGRTGSRAANHPPALLQAA